MTDTTDRPDIATQLDDPRIEAFGMLLEAHNEVAAELERRLAAAARPAGHLARASSSAWPAPPSSGCG